MPRIIRNILKRSNTIYALANNTQGIKVDRQEFNSNSRTYCERQFNNNGRFGGLTKEILYTANIVVSSGTVANVENVIPAGTMVYGITGLVTTAITGPTGFCIGFSSRDAQPMSGNYNAAANGVRTDIGTNTDMTTANTQLNFPILFKYNSNVMITSNSTTAFTGGAVRVAVHGLRFDPPNA